MNARTAIALNALPGPPVFFITQLPLGALPTIHILYWESCGNLLYGFYKRIWPFNGVILPIMADDKFCARFIRGRDKCKFFRVYAAGDKP